VVRPVTTHMPTVTPSGPRPSAAAAWRHIQSFCATVFAVAQATAEDVSPGRAPTVLSRIVVTAPPGAEAPLSAGTDSGARGAATVVSPRTFLEGRAATFEDYLRFAPGLAFASDHSGDVSKISIRGSGLQSDEALGVQILLDGLPFNQGDGEANLEELDLFAVAAADVWRGANARLHGAYVLGGAINLVSATGRTHPGGRIHASIGSFDSHRVGVLAGGHGERLDAFASVVARQTDGHREHGGERRATVHANFGQQLAEGRENRFYLSAARWRREVAGDLSWDEWRRTPESASPEALAGDFRIETDSWRVADLFRMKTPGAHFEAGALYHRRVFRLYDHYEDDYQLGVTDAASDNLGALVTLNTGDVDAAVGPLFTVGVAPLYERETSRNHPNRGGVADWSEVTASAIGRSYNLPAFAEVRFPVAARYELSLGTQASVVVRDFTDRLTHDANGDQSQRQTFRAWSPRLGLVGRITRESEWFATISRSFQPPSFDDLTPFEDGDDGGLAYIPLASQRAGTVEVGVRGRRGAIACDIALYHSRIRNELLELNDAAGRELGTVNAPRTTHQGLEAGFEINLLPAADGPRARSLTLRADYTWSDYHFVRHPVYGHNRLAGAARHAGDVELIYRSSGGFYAGPRVSWTAARTPADHANTLWVSPHALVAFRLGREASRGWEYFVEITNAANRPYLAMIKPMPDARTADQDEARIFSPGAGRAIYAGAAWRW